MRTAIQVRKFGGIDERKEFAEDLTYAVSMRNFQVTENHTLKKRYGLTNLFVAPSEITGMWSGYLGTERHFLFTAGGTLYRIGEETGLVTEIGEVGEGYNLLFEFQRKVYIKNRHRYSCYDGQTVSLVEGYVPLVAIGCAPDGSGSRFERINMLSPRRRVRFSCDGTSTVYHLPEKPVVSAIASMPDGGTLPGYSLNAQDGTLTFLQPPSQSINGLEVAYSVGEDRSEVIRGCTGVMLFGGDTDGHVFLWGNPEHPNYRFHSELADGQPSAEYFPENNYTVIGDAAITDIISQYDRQLIFTKDRAYYSYCELQTDTQGNTYASFPVYNLNGEKGSLLANAGCIMNNEPVTLCADGLNRWSSTAVENEKNAVCFSGAVGKTMAALLAGGGYDRMRLFNLRATGELFFVCGELALIWNYRVGAWYAYDNFAAERMVEHDGRLYFSHGNTIRFLDETSSVDEEGRVTAYWETPYVHLTAGGRNGRVTRIAYLARASGPVRWQIVYDDGRAQEGEHQTEISIDCNTARTVEGSFRPPVWSGPLCKLRLTEYDYAYCELCEWRLLTGQKGQYGRKGI